MRGKLRGIGTANPIERSASPSPDFAEIRFTTDGTATILMGTKSQGRAMRRYTSRSSANG